MEILNLFPTPVGISYYQEVDNLEFEVDQFINEIISEENKDKSIYNILELNGPTISKFYEFMKKGVNEYAKLIETNSEFDITQSWLLINEFAEPHHHANDPIVACFYIKGKHDPNIPNHANFSSIGDISFIDPRAGVNLYSRPLPPPPNLKDKNINNVKTPGKAGGNVFNGAGYYKFTPEPGKLLVFPGYLLHFVHKNMTKEDRIVIGSQWDRVYDLEKLDPTKPRTPRGTPYWFKSGNMNKYIELKYKK
jgi:hypothetical protein